MRRFHACSGGEIGRHACLRCMWRDPCGFESRPEHQTGCSSRFRAGGARQPVGYSSGQRGQTVNLLACAFGGSNPPPTTIQNPCKYGGFRVFRAFPPLLYHSLIIPNYPHESSPNRHPTPQIFTCLTVTDKPRPLRVWGLRLEQMARHGGIEYGDSP